MANLNLSKTFKGVGMTLKKHSPEILTAVGIVGMGATTILAVKATPKAIELLDEAKHQLNVDILAKSEVTGEEYERVEKLKPKDVVKTVWKLYIPAAVTGAMSIACIVGASSVNARRNAALMAAYTISETSLKEYKDKVTDIIGEKKEKEVREEIAKDKLKQNPVDDREVIITKRGNTLCYDILTGRYFRSDINTIDAAVNELNRRMIASPSGDISLNEFFHEIGLSNTELGNMLGWHIDWGTIKVDYTWQTADNNEPCLVVEYITKPKYDYYHW